jgi:fido (protein-threonine AMPylation protein)
MYGEEIPYKVKTESTDSNAKREYWDAAIGLQQVDGLVPSRYLYELSEKNVQGDLTLDQVEVLLNKHYSSDNRETPVKLLEQEADFVSQRIVRLLDAAPFTMNAIFFKEIHRELFTDIKGIESNAGVYRSYDIMKEEPILYGRSVFYSYSRFIAHTLDGFIHDESSQMRLYSYPLTGDDIKRIAKFTASIWQVHPFVEGNTRSTDVVIELDLRWLGYAVDNSQFAEHSEYFRNALVRACFFDNKVGVIQTTEYIEAFFDNLLNGATHTLDSAELFVENLRRITDRNRDDNGCITGL